MTQSLAIPRVIPNDWKRLDLIINKIKFHLGSASSPTFTGVTITGLTASSLIGTNASKALESVTIGTGLNYTRPTLSLSHLGIEALTDPNADKILFWDDSETACKWLSVGNSIAITTTTIDTIQDIRTSASPTFVGLDLTGTLTVDTINEHTGAAGVTIEGILIKDSDINLQDYDAVLFGDAQDAYIYFDGTRLLINSISEVWIGVEYDKPLVAGNLFSNGNVNIGYTAMRHTWKDYYDVLEIGGTGALFCNTSVLASMMAGISQNAYFDETDERWEYAVADEASVYIQNVGRHIFYVNNGAGAEISGPISWSCGLIVEKDATVVCEGASVTIGKASTTTGALVLHDSNSANTITLTVPDISAGSLSFTLPATDGDNTNVLQTDGNGVLSWAAAGGGASTWIELTDTDPANYTGDAGKCVVVNAGEDGLEFGPIPGGAFTSRFSAYLSSNQTLTTGTWTKVLFNTENFDGDGEYDNATNYRFTATNAGYYFIGGVARFTALGTDIVFGVALNKNSGTYLNVNMANEDASANRALDIFIIVYLAANDYVELEARQDSGGNANVEGGANKTIFFGHRLS